MRPIWTIFPLILIVRASGPDNCPKLCECELQSDHTIAVYCNRGGINDTVFYKILESASDRTSLLEISAPFNRPNNFRFLNYLILYDKI